MYCPAAACSEEAVIVMKATGDRASKFTVRTTIIVHRKEFGYGSIYSISNYSSDNCLFSDFVLPRTPDDRMCFTRRPGPTGYIRAGDHK